MTKAPPLGKSQAFQEICNPRRISNEILIAIADGGSGPPVGQILHGPGSSTTSTLVGWLSTAQHENGIAPEQNPALVCSEQNAALTLREAVLGLRWRWVALCAELRWRILRWGCAGAEAVLALGCAGAGLLLRWLVLRSSC